MKRFSILDLILHGLFLVFALALWLWAPSARAQEAPSSCQAWPAWEARLATRWHEIPTWIGLMPDGSKLLITQAADGSTWTLLRIVPDGTACLIGEGRAWAPLDPPPPGERS